MPRHEFFERQQARFALQANAIRIVTSDGAIAIDEIEVSGVVVPEPASLMLWALLGLGLTVVGYCRCGGRGTR